ncbi:MAG: DUF5654 family protein [Patescibacteria group bacterium]
MENNNESKNTEKEIKLDWKQITKLFENYEFRRFQYDFFEKVALLIISALGFITALAWVEAAKVTFQQLFGGLTTITQRFLYALLITLISVIISVVIGKVFLRRKSRK